MSSNSPSNGASRSRPRPNVTSMLFNNAMDRIHPGSTPASRTGLRGLALESKSMRDGEPLEDTGFGQDRAANRNNTNAQASSSKASSFPATTRQSNNHFAHEPIPIPRPKKGSTGSSVREEPKKPPKAMNPYLVGRNTLDEPARPSRPSPNHRDAASAPSSRAQPASSGQPGWGTQNRGPPKRSHEPWVAEAARERHVGNDPEVTWLPGSSKSRPPSSTSSVSLSNQPETLRARPPALSSSSSGPPLVSDPKNAAAGPSKPRDGPANPKIDRHQAQRHRVEHAGSTPARPSAKRTDVIDLEADDEDDDAEDPIEDFDELDSDGDRRPLKATPNARRLPRAPSPRHQRLPHSPKPAAAISTPLMTQSRQPLPDMKRKKADLAGAVSIDGDDDVWPIQPPRGIVQQRVAAIEPPRVTGRSVSVQHPPLQAAAVPKGVQGRMKGPSGQAVVSPPSTKAASASRSRPTSVRAPSPEDDVQSFVAEAWWRGFKKTDSGGKPGSHNVVVTGGVFKLGGDLEIPFSSILRIRMTKPSASPFLISLELSDDGHRDKIIPNVSGARMHSFAKKSINIHVDEKKSPRQLQGPLRSRFGSNQGRDDGSSSVEIMTITATEATELKTALYSAPIPPPKPPQNAPPNLFSPRTSRSQKSATHPTVNSTTVTNLDDSDEPDAPVVGPSRSRPARPPCKNPAETRATWPLTGKSVIDITNGDYHRTLDDTEFLNDTMVEYGLRSALEKAVTTFPDLEQDVHIFSTYLYTKLNAKKKAKDGEDPWKVVSRWTRKFDLFAKKYVIVPINEDFHWYLAIIVNPSALLRRPEEKMPPEIKTMTRSNSRTDGGPVDVDAQASTSAAQEDATVGLEQPEGTADDARDDEEVEQALEVAEGGRSSGGHSPREPGDDAASLAAPVVSQPADAADSVRENLSQITLENKPGADQGDVQMNEPEIEPRPEPRADDRSPSPPTPPADVSQPGHKPDPQTGKNSGYIFMLDSLGTTHVAAGKLLNRYLASEAKERKQIDFEPAPLVCKKLDVPTQPDYSSCGVYVIHYVECFLRRPTDVIEAGLKDARAKGQTQVKDELWRKEELPDARSRLRQSVDDLVAAWKAKEAEATPVDAADDAATKHVDGGPSPLGEPVADPRLDEGPAVVQPRDGALQPSVPVQADKGKGREQQPLSDQAEVAPSPSPKRPNPFNRPAPASAPAAPVPPPTASHEADRAPTSPLPAEEVPSLPRASPPPVPPSQALTRSSPIDATTSKEDAFDGWEEVDSSSESEDHRPNGHARRETPKLASTSKGRALLPTSAVEEGQGDQLLSEEQPAEAASVTSSGLFPPLRAPSAEVTTSRPPQSIYRDARANIKAHNAASMSPPKGEGPSTRPKPIARANALPLEDPLPIATDPSPSAPRTTRSAPTALSSSPLPQATHSRSASDRRPNTKSKPSESAAEYRIQSAPSSMIGRQPGREEEASNGHGLRESPPSRARQSSPSVRTRSSPRHGAGLSKRLAGSPLGGSPPIKKRVRSHSPNKPTTFEPPSDGTIGEDALDLLAPSPQLSRLSSHSKPPSSTRAVKSSSSLGVAVSTEARAGSSSRSSNGSSPKPSSRSDEDGQDPGVSVVEEADDEAEEDDEDDEDPMALLEAGKQSKYFPQSKRKQSVEQEEDAQEVSEQPAAKRPKAAPPKKRKPTKTQAKVERAERARKAKEKAAEDKAALAQRNREAEEDMIVLSD